MKKLFLLFFLTFYFFEIQSQTYSYCSGDSIYLGLASYTGSLQWQQSSDSVNWTNISGATYSPYGFIFSTPKYYRAKVTAPNCSPIYSSVQHAVLASGCQLQYPAGSVFCNGPTIVVDVLNPVTGKTWMNRNLGASQVATSSTDSLSYGDYYQWGRGSDGHQCRNSATTSTLSSSNQPGNSSFILSNYDTLALYPPFGDWKSTQNNNLWQGLNGVNNPCPINYRLPTSNELDEERLSWSQNNSDGAFASPLKLPLAGYRYSISGWLSVNGTWGGYWSSTIGGNNCRQSNILYFNPPNSSGQSNTWYSSRAMGFSVRCIKAADSFETFNLKCSNSYVSGNLFVGQIASNVSVSVPYTGGDGSFYPTQNYSSTGVLGLTATLNSGNLTNCNGVLIFTISGTPNTNGTASFLITIGGQTCTLNVNVTDLSLMYPVGSVFCNGPTAIVEVLNPATGKTWMDRNLGASQVAISNTDSLAYGDLYQWGRGSDGHQCRNSAIVNWLSSSDQPGHGDFIIDPNLFSSDWRDPQNDNLWQGVNGINNPCPIGYRLPTDIELDEERLSWSQNNSDGAFASPLKYPVAGFRDYPSGVFLDVNIGGYYCSSTINSSDILSLFFEGVNFGSAGILASMRGHGFSVRCIKDY